MSDLLYESAEGSALTTLGTVYEGKSCVFFCARCGHVQSSELPNLSAYYDLEYEINIRSSEEDQLYKREGDISVFRADHQADTFLRKVNLPQGSHILDYGSGKGATLKKILAQRPDITPYVFDVTEKYIPFWQAFPKNPLWATYAPDMTWRGKLDVVMSFFVFEHTNQLQDKFREIHSLLKEGGTFYFIVPNTYVNMADFIVVDHINHFSETSIRYLLSEIGFTTIEVDPTAHDTAFVVLAKKSAHPPRRYMPEQKQLDSTHSHAQKLGHYWRSISKSIHTFEENLDPHSKFAIYGAGFYGSFVRSSLKNPTRLTCYIDQNAHLQGRLIEGKPVVSPDQIPPQVDTILVGLNPLRSKAIIEGIDALKKRHFHYFWL